MVENKQNYCYNEYGDSMEIFKMLFLFVIIFILVDVSSKRYATLFLLFFVDAYFFNLYGRLMSDVFKETDISYISRSLAQPFIEIYQGMTGKEFIFDNSNLLLIFFIVWSIIIILTVINRGIDNGYLKRYHVKEIIAKMRHESVNAPFVLDFVKKTRRSYQYIYIDSISYLHIFSYQYHVSKYQVIHQRIKLDTIQEINFVEVDNAYKIEIQLDDHRILNGGTYRSEYLSNLKELEEAIQKLKQKKFVEPTTKEKIELEENPKVLEKK